MYPTMTDDEKTILTDSSSHSPIQLGQYLLECAGYDPTDYQGQDNDAIADAIAEWYEEAGCTLIDVLDNQPLDMRRYILAAL